MKTLSRVILVVTIGILLSASTVFSGNANFSGFLGDPGVYQKLTPGPDGGAQLRWLKPGVDFSKYDKFMVDGVVFYLADDSEYKGIDPQEMKEMADSCNKEIVDALKYKYTIVSEPGPGVGRIRFAITKIKASRPGVSAVTSIIPVGIGISVVKKGVTGGWSGSGATGTELMVLDSSTNEVIAMAVDERQAGYTERFSKWGSATDAFKFWSERIVKFLDDAKGKKMETEE